MVSHRVDPAERRRCKRACNACKHRKERCDGSQPCRRCKERGVEDDCCFKVEARPRPRRTRAECSRDPSQSVSLSMAEGHGNHVSESMWTEDAADTTTPAAVAMLASESPNSIEVDHSRFIQDKKGRYIFIGDSANLSFLHSVRCVARDALGSCPFVDDPLRSSMVEASPEASSKRPGILGHDGVPELSRGAAANLVRQFFVVTDGVVDLFDESEIIAVLPHVLSSSDRIASPTRAIAYLVLAIGAQSQSDLVNIADACFNHGRFLTGQYLIEDVSIQSTQLYVLISLYLLGASRRNSAFVCLGQGVRSAYTLGIHQRANLALFSKAEARQRERLWRSIRMVDLFTSASLGRPPSTTEPKASCAETSSTADELCAILEMILTDVYGQRKITTSMLARVGSRQRRWAADFAHAASISDKDGSAADGSSIGSMHVKQTYYWTIMLLTRPFLVDRVTTHAKAIVATPRQPIQACVLVEPSKTLIYACVDSAIKTVSLLEPLLAADTVPRHLPVLINAAFHAALVLAFSYFGDLYTVFPLEHALRKSHEILRLFPYDLIAMRYLAITQYLRDACSAYFERRHAASMALESEAISHLFGQIHVARLDKSHTKDPRRVDGEGASDRWSESRTPHAQAILGDAMRDPTTNGSAHVLEGITFPSPDTGSENDLVAQLEIHADLNLDFPMTQHVWFDSNTFPSIFAGVDLLDPDVSFLGQ